MALKRETMKRVSHQQASQLLRNKFIVVLGDSIQRSVYKDIVLLLQKEKYLTSSQLKSKGEMSFEQDCLVEGGCLNGMHNGTEYREVRQFQSAHHLVRFYFVTRIYSRYMQSILEDFRSDLKPDLVIINSCVWDISRYLSNWIDDYKNNLHKFFVELNGILPKESLVIWNLTMPLGERIKGGFLVSEIEHKAPQLRHDVIEANFYSGTLANSRGLDVLDLHFQFRFSLQHRAWDGVHWDALAHRRITSLLLEHSAQAWGVILPRPCAAVEHTEFTDQQPSYGNTTRPAEHHSSKGNYNGYSKKFSDSLFSGYLNVKENNPQSQKYHHATAGAGRLAYPPPLLHLPVHRHKHGQVRTGFYYSPPHHFEPHMKHHHHHHHVMRNRYNRHQYNPYAYHRPSWHGSHGHYY